MSIVHMDDEAHELAGHRVRDGIVRLDDGDKKTMPTARMGGGHHVQDVDAAGQAPSSESACWTRATISRSTMRTRFF